MHDPTGHWISLWTTAPTRVDAPPIEAVGEGSHGSWTLRQTFRVALGTARLRLTISNEFGNSTLHVNRLSVARPLPRETESTAGSSIIDPATLRTATFGGGPSVEIPLGVSVITDELDFDVAGWSDISISIHVLGAKSSAPLQCTGHFDGKTDTWAVPGDGTDLADTGPGSGGRACQRSYFVTRIDGVAPRSAFTIACFGDSITDRGDSKLPHNEYFGWIDHLSARLRSLPVHASVLNLGISGDQLYNGGLARLDRDVFGQHGLAFVFVHMGVNDLGVTPPDAKSQDRLLARLQLAYRQIATKAHMRGVPVIGSTVMPFLSPPGWSTPWPFADARREETRLRLNHWLLEEGPCDHCVDFAAAVTDPANPHRIRKEFQLCDFLHPSPAGYRAMADAIDVGCFVRVVRKGG